MNEINESQLPEGTPRIVFRPAPGMAGAVSYCDTGPNVGMYRVYGRLYLDPAVRDHVLHGHPERGAQLITRLQAADELLAQIKAAVETGDGSWPGADMVQLISSWLVANGITREQIDGPGTRYGQAPDAE
jgi:hypothetical protein